MKNKTRKLIALALIFVFAFCATGNLAPSVMAEDTMNYGLLIGDAPEGFYESAPPLPPNVKLASSFDITSVYGKYFPAIMDQGNLGSCASFASTYYAFTYMANKLNGITTTPENTYSPKWTNNAYNSYNEEKKRFIGITLSTAYAFLQNHGALRQADFPYVGNMDDIDNYKELPSEELEDEMLEALSTRMSRRFLLEGSTEHNSWVEGDTIIYSVEGTIEMMKHLLSQGTVLNVNMVMDWDAVYVNDTVGNVGIRTTGCEADNPEKIEGRWHAVTVVGYDDTLWVDINQNGKQDSGEFGAFKIANSEGPNWGLRSDTSQGTKNGYFWIAYDSLYLTTQVSGNWDTSPYRVGAFTWYPEGRNEVYYFEVANYPVHYVAKFTVTAQNRHDAYVRTAVRDNASTEIDEYQLENGVYPGWEYDTQFQNPYDSCEGLPVYVDLNTPDTKLLVRQYFRLLVENATSYDVELIDNHANTIRFFSGTAELFPGGADPVAPDNSVRPTVPNVYNARQLPGDVNYNNGIDMGDVRLVLLYATDPSAASSLQYCIADYNGDGVVNTADAADMLDAI